MAAATKDNTMVNSLIVTMEPATETEDVFETVRTQMAARILICQYHIYERLPIKQLAITRQR